MNTFEIKMAIEAGRRVMIYSGEYEVIKDGEEFMIHCKYRGSKVKLHHNDGFTLRHPQKEFYTVEE